MDFSLNQKASSFNQTPSLFYLSPSIACIREGFTKWDENASECILDIHRQTKKDRKSPLVLCFICLVVINIKFEMTQHTVNVTSTCNILILSGHDIYILLRKVFCTQHSQISVLHCFLCVMYCFIQFNIVKKHRPMILYSIYMCLYSRYDLQKNQLMRNLLWCWSLNAFIYCLHKYVLSLPNIYISRLLLLYICNKQFPIGVVLVTFDKCV